MAPLMWYRDGDGLLKPFAVPGDDLSFAEATYAGIPVGWAGLGPPTVTSGDQRTAFVDGAWVCPSSGVWQITVQVASSGPAVGARISGTKGTRSAEAPAAATTSGVEVAWTLEAAVGDRLDLQARVGSGSVTMEVTATRLRRYAVATATQEGAEYVLRAGDTMEGPLYLAADPTDAMEATTAGWAQAYADSKVVNAYAGGSTTEAPSQAAVQSAIDAAAAKTVGAGAGLSGGGAIGGNPQLNVGKGTGITVAADTVAVDTTVIATRAYADGKVTNALGSSTTVAPSQDAVSDGLATKAATSHSHPYTQAGIRAGTFSIGTVPAGGTAGPFTVAHGLGRMPTAVVVTGTDDTGSHSIVMSLASWDATNFVALARNLGGANEAARGSWIAVG